MLKNNQIKTDQKKFMQVLDIVSGTSYDCNKWLCQVVQYGFLSYPTLDICSFGINCNLVYLWAQLPDLLKTCIHLFSEMGNHCCKSTPNDQMLKLPQITFPYKSNYKYDYLHQKKTRPEKMFCVEGEKGKETLHRTICAITIAPKSGLDQFGYGSGILISKDLMLTAAHILYDREQHRQCEKTSVKVYLGVNGIAENHFEVEDWRYSSEFKNCQSKDRLENDYALIKLKQAADCEKFVPLALPCSCVLDRKKELLLKIFGYPQHQNYQPQDERGKNLKLNQYGLAKEDSILEAVPDDFVLVHNVSTLSGQSGCPIVVDDRVIALHVGAAMTSETANIGRLFTLGLLENLSKWSKQLKGTLFLKSNNSSCRLCSSSKPKEINRSAQVIKESNKNPENKISIQQLIRANTADPTNAAIQLLYTAVKLNSQGRYMQAKSILQNLAKATESIFGEKCLQSTPFRLQIAISQMGMHNLELAFSILEEILEIHRKKKAIDNAYARALMIKGIALHMLYHYKEALVALEQSLSVCKDLKDVGPLPLVMEIARWTAMCLKQLDSRQRLEEVMKTYGLEPKDLQLKQINYRQ